MPTGITPATVGARASKMAVIKPRGTTEHKSAQRGKTRQSAAQRGTAQQKPQGSASAVGCTCCLRSSSLLTSASLNLVGTMPGAIPLTRVPAEPISCASAFTTPRSAVLDTAYAEIGGDARKAVMEETKRMEAAGARCGCAAATSAIEALMLTERILSIAAGGVSRRGPIVGLTTAFRMRTSILLYACRKHHLNELNLSGCGGLVEGV